jgi:hypothetical protein
VNAVELLDVELRVDDKVEEEEEATGPLIFVDIG